MASIPTMWSCEQTSSGKMARIVEIETNILHIIPYCRKEKEKGCKTGQSVNNKL